MAVSVEMSLLNMPVTTFNLAETANVHGGSTWVRANADPVVRTCPICGQFHNPPIDITYEADYDDWHGDMVSMAMRSHVTGLVINSLPSVGFVNLILHTEDAVAGTQRREGLILIPDVPESGRLRGGLLSFVIVDMPLPLTVVLGVNRRFEFTRFARGGTVTLMDVPPGDPIGTGTVSGAPDLFGQVGLPGIVTIRTYGPRRPFIANFFSIGLSAHEVGVDDDTITRVYGDVTDKINELNSGVTHVKIIDLPQ